MLSHFSTESKICEFDIIILVDEDVGRLHVPMDDSSSLPIVAVMQSADNLGGQFPDNVFIDGILFLSGIFDQLAKVSSFTVLHNDVHDLSLLIDDPTLVLDDVWVWKFFEDIDFGYELLFLVVLHLTVTDFLGDENFVVWSPGVLFDQAEGAFTDLLDEFVIFLHIADGLFWNYNCY